MSDTEIRRARLADAVEMARLAGELGYPTSADEMTRRLGVLLANDRHHIVVATDGSSLCGWVHVEHRFSLDGGDRGELMGLVVDARRRRSGLGRELVRIAEAWTAARGIPWLTVRSNAARAESHPFYEAQGFTRSKTQHVYTKALGAEQ
jgi:GNAT superfamily N-acetyltransferase